MSDFAAIVKPYGTELPLVACTSCGNRARWTLRALRPHGEQDAERVISSCGDCLEGQLSDLAEPPPQPVTVELIPKPGPTRTCTLGPRGCPGYAYVVISTADGRQHESCSQHVLSLIRALAESPIEAEIIDDAEPVHMRPPARDSTVCGLPTAPTSATTGPVWSTAWDRVTCPDCLQRRPPAPVHYADRAGIGATPTCKGSGIVTRNEANVTCEACLRALSPLGRLPKHLGATP